MNNLELTRKILDALHPRGSRIVTFSDLANRVLGADLDPARENALRGAVADLERRGEIVRVKGEKLSRIEFTEFQLESCSLCISVVLCVSIVNDRSSPQRHAESKGSTEETRSR